MDSRNGYSAPSLNGFAGLAAGSSPIGGYKGSSADQNNQNLAFNSNQAPSLVPSIKDMPYEVIHFKEGQMLFNEGDVPRGLYYVQSGCVKVTKHRDQIRGRTTTADYLTKLVSGGEFFGYKALVKESLSGVSAQAVKNTVVWLYPADYVRVAIQQAGPFVKMLLEQAVNDLENFEATNQLHYLASVQERIAHQLVVLGDRFGVQGPSGISINLKLTRNEFAQLASTINESLSRHLTEFKAEGLIDLNGKEIIIKNRDGLLARSKGG